ncbi:hypothetical protein PMIN03_003703 [Paraphaeosphaeria minitans]
MLAARIFTPVPALRNRESQVPSGGSVLRDGLQPAGCSSPRTPRVNVVTGPRNRGLDLDHPAIRTNEQLTQYMLSRVDPPSLSHALCIIQAIGGGGATALLLDLKGIVRQQCNFKT